MQHEFFTDPTPTPNAKLPKMISAQNRFFSFFTDLCQGCPDFGLTNTKSLITIIESIEFSVCFSKGGNRSEQEYRQNSVHRPGCRNGDRPGGYGRSYAGRLIFPATFSSAYNRVE